MLLFDWNQDRGKRIKVFNWANKVVSTLNINEMVDVPGKQTTGFVLFGQKNLILMIPHILFINL